MNLMEVFVRSEGTNRLL